MPPEGGPPRYRTTTPAEAGPEVYSHVALIDPAQGYLRDVNPVQAFEITGSSGGWAQVVLGPEGCNVYEFEPPLRPRAARITSGRELGHKMLENQGVPGQPFERCPYLHDALPLRKNGRLAAGAQSCLSRWPT